MPWTSRASIEAFCDCVLNRGTPLGWKGWTQRCAKRWGRDEPEHVDDLGKFYDDANGLFKQENVPFSEFYNMGNEKRFS